MLSLLFLLLSFKCTLCQQIIQQVKNRKKSIMWWWCLELMQFSWSSVALRNNSGKDQVRKILQTILTISLSSFLAKVSLDMIEHSISSCIHFLDSAGNTSFSCQISMKILQTYLRKKQNYTKCPDWSKMSYAWHCICKG